MGYKTMTGYIAKEHLRKKHLIIGEYKGERVRIDDCDNDYNLYIFIPSRQESVWVTPDKVEIIEVEA